MDDDPFARQVHGHVEEGLATVDVSGGGELGDADAVSLVDQVVH